MQEKTKLKTFTALVTLYLAWSSTYLAIRIALVSFPPFFVAGFRYMLVGAGMYLYLRWKGAAAPTRAEWGGSAAAGAFLLLGGTAGVVYAEKWVASGIAALVLATTPLLTVLFNGFWKQWPAKREWVGLLLGFVGIILLNMGGNLSAHPAGAVLLVLAAICWSFGSVLSLHVAMPPGMMASAAQMFMGGLIVFIVSLAIGEKIPLHPAMRAVGAFVYLGIFGSLLGYTAYTYLLNNVRPSLATSYAYVNPVLAVLLGVWIASERITKIEVAAMLTILAGVVLVIVTPIKERKLVDEEKH